MTQSEIDSKKPKTKEQYSRNVKKLKIKLMGVQNEIETLQRKVQTMKNTSNDKMISMKISKFCKQRRFTPQMLFRFADKKGLNKVSKIEFGQTLNQIGLSNDYITSELSKDELMRLEYLVDQDLSGQITYAEYNQYLRSFGLKKEYNQNDLNMKDVFNKIDLGKIIGIEKDSKYANLLDYEQFLKYCHKHFPHLSTKELARIFNQLQKNGKVSIQDLFDYLKNLQQEKRRLQQKNKKRKPIQKKTSIDVDASKTLKGIILCLFRYRIKQSNLQFHSSQFNRLERIMKFERGHLLSVFKEIDIKKKGSFGFNELVRYFIQKQKKGADLPFAFQIMGKKISSMNQKPQAIISQYNNRSELMTDEQFCKFVLLQFDIQKPQADLLLKLIPRAAPQDPFKVESLIQLMNIAGFKKKIVYVKPNLIGTNNKEFVYKKNALILYSGMHALRFCLSIVERMAEVKEALWHDFEFGPTQDDQHGVESIQMALPSEQIEWIRVNELGFNEFIGESMSKESIYECSALCTHETFAKSLYFLIQQNPEHMYYKNKIDYSITEIKQQNLNILFKGLYPLVFHQFAKYGIFVFKFFQKGKWVYVIMDNKIPCGSDKVPYFSTTKNRRYSWISLIEKAYAKLKGSYKELFEQGIYSQYISELSRLLVTEDQFPKAFPSQQTKNKLWSKLLSIKQRKQKIYCRAQQGKGHVMMDNVDTGIQKAYPISISDLIELEDPKSKNAHKSHRLLMLEGAESKNQFKWNPAWSRGDQTNKYDTFSDQIEVKIKKNIKNKTLINQANLLLVNFKLFRSFFDTLIAFNKVNFEDMIILKKELQLQEKFKCRYQIASQESISLIVVMNKINSSAQTQIKLDFRDDKQQIISQSIHRGNYFCKQLNLEQNKNNIVQIYVNNWNKDSKFIYSLTFYLPHPRYTLKERDRHLLFRYLSEYQQESKFVFNQFGDKQKLYIYDNFYKGAHKRGCCGCI